MRLSRAGRAALLVLLAAHFQASLALEEKKGKDARAAVLPVPGGRAFRRAAEECASRLRAAGQPPARGAGRGGPRSPERGFPLCSPALRRLDVQASASQHVRPQSARPGAEGGH